MGGRILRIAPARSVHWTMIVAACLAAVAAGIGLSRLGETPSSPPAPVRPAVAPAPQAGLAKAPAVASVAPAASATPAAAVCPLQSLVLARAGAAAQTVCMDATTVRQTGDVRSYIVNAGDAQGWSLRVDMVERRLLSASLQARDGRSHACEAGRCQGLALLTEGGAAQRLSLRELRLPKVSAPGAASATAAAASADAGDLLVSAELRVPADDQVPGLACVGPSVSIGTAGGAARNFCGLGGAGVEIVGDGHHNYRFQDLEGRTLMIAVDAEQRVVGVELEPYACKGAACTGASTASAAPDNPLAERSFYFGRTALFDGPSNSSARPGIVLNGSLVMPSQQ